MPSSSIHYDYHHLGRQINALQHAEKSSRSDTLPAPLVIVFRFTRTAETEETQEVLWDHAPALSSLSDWRFVYNWKDEPLRNLCAAMSAPKRIGSDDSMR